MNRVTIREVTRENWRDALRLTVAPVQQRFIADYAPIAAVALAKAYIRPGGLVWTPYVFFADATMVGFCELAYEPESAEQYWLFHFFIDERFQGRGYGTDALAALIAFVKEQRAGCQALQLTVHPENHVARWLYMRAGFAPTGGELEGEPVYRLTLGDRLSGA
jgi:diamine N-acetyltransferase